MKKHLITKLLHVVLAATAFFVSSAPLLAQEAGCPVGQKLADGKCVPCIAGDACPSSNSQ